MRLALATIVAALLPNAGGTALRAGDQPAARSPDYAVDVAPIFRRYCLGCHNAQEAEGGLVLESHAQAMRGGEHGAVIVPGQADKSRLILALEKRKEPFMPPEGNKGPTSAEILTLRAWIAAGAHASKYPQATAVALVTPKIEPVGTPRNPVEAVAFSPDGQWVAAGQYGSVEILAAADHKRVRSLTGITGAVNDVVFSPDGRLLLAAAGQPGLFGELTIWSTTDWSRLRMIRGHRDALLAAEMSADEKTVATASYDQTIRLWNAEDGKELRVLRGHNGPVFDIAFDPTGRLLASASGDRTVKLWDVAKGERLDTFSQPTKDQYAVAFTHDGRFVVAGGVDSRIRVWRISPSAKEGTNELVESLFAHDGPIIRLAVSPDGRRIASSSEDRTIKIWDAVRFAQIEALADQSDWTTALAISPDSKTLAAGRMDGSLSFHPLGESAARVDGLRPIDYASMPMVGAVGATATLNDQVEKEPNDSPQLANDVAVPGTVHAVLGPHPKAKSGASMAESEADVDYFRFHANAGQTLILETEAMRKNSPADTRLDVLHADGSPVLRCLLRAVRDSVITFRGIDSRAGGVRLENWREMDLDQFLYLSGEVCRLLRAPRGPDSEYDLYMENGSRRCYFDTSGVGHVLGEPVYIVEPYPPGTRLPDNGLPVFPVYYSNDDDGSRKLGSDSRLTFTAPADGTYLARVADVRGFGGPDFKYLLTIREPRPDFHASINPPKLTLAAGGGQRLTVNLDRVDNFEGEVRIDVAGVPRGYHVSSPMVIEKGFFDVRGSLNADADAKPLPVDVWKRVKVTATATLDGRRVEKSLPVGNKGAFPKVKLVKRPPIIVRLVPDDSTFNSAVFARPGASRDEIVIEPGRSVTAMLEIERYGYKGELRFEVEGLPHGVIVDNIGLNGIMIREGESRRQVFLTSEKWVKPTVRLIHAVADREGNQTSRSIRLRVAAVN